jgi:hypothetical protein
MRQVLPVVGAAIGAYFGGQAGAQIGWAIGSVIGNAVDPQVIKGPSLGDLSQQTAQEGGPRGIVFGLSQPMSGNIVFCSKPVIKTVEQQSGKGGGPITESQKVYRTYAIGICEGPITAIIRVWKNGKLVYDARPGGDASNNAKFLAATRIFLGDYAQMPSPDIEAIVGAGEAPAMRGTCYICRPNEDLTDQGGAVPQFVFQVLRCEGQLYTSRPYAVEVLDDISTNMVTIKVEPQPYVIQAPDVMQSVMQLLSITRFGGQVNFTLPNEDKVQSTLQILSITRFGSEVNLLMPNEDKVQSTVTITSITRFGGQVGYTTQTDEVQASIEILSITRS